MFVIEEDELTVGGATLGYEPFSDVQNFGPAAAWEPREPMTAIAVGAPSAAQGNRPYVLSVEAAAELAELTGPAADRNFDISPRSVPDASDLSIFRLYR